MKHLLIIGTAWLKYISFYGIHSYCLSWMNEYLGIMIKQNSYLKKYVFQCFLLWSKMWKSNNLVHPTYFTHFEFSQSTIFNISMLSLFLGHLLYCYWCHPPSPNSDSYCFLKHSPAGKKSQHLCWYISQTYVSCPVYSVSSLPIRYIKKNLKNKELVRLELLDLFLKVLFKKLLVLNLSHFQKLTGSLQDYAPFQREYQNHVVWHPNNPFRCHIWNNCSLVHLERNPIGLWVLQRHQWWNLIGVIFYH